MGKPISTAALISQIETIRQQLEIVRLNAVSAERDIVAGIEMIEGAIEILKIQGNRGVNQVVIEILESYIKIVTGGLVYQTKKPKENAMQEEQGPAVPAEEPDVAQTGDPEAYEPVEEKTETAEEAPTEDAPDEEPVAEEKTEE